MDDKTEAEIKEEADNIMKKWREMAKPLNPEEKCEISKPEEIPFRRPKPEVLEEKSPEKIEPGEGSIYDPMKAFKYMD